MDRREFSKSLGAGVIALSIAPTLNAKKRAPQIAITMDDFSWAHAIHQTAAERNQAILETLKGHSLRAGLFVLGRNIEDQEGKTLLAQWNDAGHLIGNHTYSHRNFGSPTMSLETFENDILRAEALLQPFSKFQKYFRFPMLKEGDTAVKRDGLRQFLISHGYKVGHVTIDNSDWIVDQRLTARLKTNPNADLTPYRDFYLEHMLDRAQYYDGLAQKVLGRPVKHTILTHYNLLNGLFLNDLISMFKSKGWQFISAEEAFSDSVFAAKPKVLPAGESIVWAVAKENGTIAKSLRYPAEDGEYETAKMNRLGL